MKFVNREKEMETLNREYFRENSFVVIYGRRRTGKTTLIKEFIKDKKAFYFFADKQNEKMQIARFKNQMADFFKDSFLEKIDIDSWDTLFHYIKSKISSEEKFVLVIDEFQYLTMVNSEFSSIFQRIYDEILKNSNIMLILCGSLITMMYSEVLAYNSPLYGRRTASINLAPIKFRYYKEFFKERSHQEMIEFYSVTGGVPKYIEEMNLEKPLLENIENYILDKNNYLYSEAKFLLQEEINDISRYFSILQVISGGETKLSGIASRLGIPSTSLTSYISKLIELEILEREVPVTEENILNSKKSLYSIKDNFLAFWFNYVYPYSSYLEMENLKFPMKKIESELDLWVSKIYEKLCRENLIYENIDFPLLKIGRWWNNQEEIDIVGIGENEIVFGECKWSKKPVGLSVLKDLERKSQEIKFKKQYEIYYILFSKSGFSQELMELAEKDKKIILGIF